MRKKCLLNTTLIVRHKSTDNRIQICLIFGQTILQHLTFFWPTKVWLVLLKKMVTPNGFWHTKVMPCVNYRSIQELGQLLSCWTKVSFVIFQIRIQNLREIDKLILIQLFKFLLLAFIEVEFTFSNSLTSCPTLVQLNHVFSFNIDTHCRYTIGVGGLVPNSW